MISHREKQVATEQTVLGELTLATPEEIDRVLNRGLNVNTFSDYGHRAVFEAIVSLHRAHTPADAVTVSHAMGEKLKTFGGEQLLIELLDSSINTCHLEHHVDVLLDLDWKATTADGLTSILNQLGDSACPVDDIRDAMRAIVDKTSNDESRLPAFMTSGVPVDEFLERDVKPEYLISRVLCRGEEMIVGAPEKTLKTGFLADMAISMASGTPFLGYEQFAVPKPVRVCFMTTETGEAALQSLISRVTRAKQLHPEDIGKMLTINQELPIIANDRHMRELKKYVNGEGIDSLLLDPAYLTLFDEGSKVQASNLFEMGPLLRRITEVRKETGVTFAMAHHTRKAQGPPDYFKFRKTTRDDLSQAGFAQWMRQWILLSRKVAYTHDGKHVIHAEIGGSSGHGGEYVLQVDEGKRDNGENQILTDWQTVVTPAREFDDAAKAAKAENGDAQKNETFERNVAKVLDAMRKHAAESSLAKTNIAGAAKVNNGIATTALFELLSRGEVTQDGTKWKLVSTESDKPDNTTGQLSCPVLDQTENRTGQQPPL